MNSRILLLGKLGQVGWELHRCLLTLGQVTALGRRDLDLSREADVREAVRSLKPTLIVNAAACTAVDRSESEWDYARAVNALAPGVLAEEAEALGAGLIHYSTDYVFDGTKPCAYTEEDEPAPINAYGRSKLEGERAIQLRGCAFLILRTSWVYSTRRSNFMLKILGQARSQESLRVVGDQIGSPTWARVLAEVTAQVVAQGRSDPIDFLRARGGLYHLAGCGAVSRHEWAERILELDPRREEHIARGVIPVKSDETPGLAQRPRNSALDCGLFLQTFGFALPHWADALAVALDDRAS